jgi:glycosyltransferase involved in cell wall biosynthesis
MSTVSICLTTYNRGNILGDTIDSILDQTFTDFELIINDDNSSDSTRDICEAYVRKDSRVKYFRNEINLKMPGNLNSAISKASGDFIANLHDGDIYRPDLIEKWFNLLQKYPEALFVFNQYQMLDKYGIKTQLIDHQLAEINDGKCLVAYFFKNLTSAPWGTVMARKDAYQNFGFFDPSYEFISDVEMWLRLGGAGKVCYVSEPLIELTPREVSHKYFLPNCKITFSSLNILKKYYLINNFGFKKEYIKKSIEKDLIHSILILIKYLDLNRLREFMYIIYKSPFFKIKLIFFPFLIFFPKKPSDFQKSNWFENCKYFSN